MKKSAFISDETAGLSKYLKVLGEPGYRLLHDILVHRWDCAVVCEKKFQIYLSTSSSVTHGFIRWRTNKRSIAYKSQISIVIGSIIKAPTLQALRIGNEYHSVLAYWENYCWDCCSGVASGESCFHICQNPKHALSRSRRRSALLLVDCICLEKGEMVSNQNQGSWSGTPKVLKSEIY